MKTTREKYIEDSVEKAIGNMKSLYKVVNSVTGNAIEKVFPTFDCKENIANDMTKFYSEKVENIRNAINEDILNCNIQREPDEPFAGSNSLDTFSVVSANEISSLINDETIDILAVSETHLDHSIADIE